MAPFLFARLRRPPAAAGTSDDDGNAAPDVRFRARAVSGRASLPPPLESRASLPQNGWGLNADDYPPDAPGVYHRMLRDAQVRACLTAKQMAVLSEQVEVHPAPHAADPDLARQTARAVGEQLEDLPGGASGLVRGALDALGFGHAIGEMIWNPDGTLARVAWHDPTRFRFHLDQQGQVTEIEVTDARLRLPPTNFVRWAYQSRYGSPYGESDLAPAYRAWVTKDHVQRMWLHALDRFGAPIPVARVPSNWPQDEVDRLNTLLGRIQHQSSLVIPADVQLDITLDAGRIEPAQAFVTAISYQDTQIARAILGQELTTQGSSSGSGSYALGRVHENMLTDRVQALRDEIAGAVLTDQIARAIVRVQFGPDAPVPLIRFPNLTESEIAARRELVTGLVSGGIIAPSEPWLRRFLGLPDALPTPEPS